MSLPFKSVSIINFLKIPVENRLSWGKSVKMEVNKSSKNVIYLIALCLFFIKTSAGYFITIDAHSEECYFDRVKSGTKMSLMFEVAEGGFLDIDVIVSLLLNRFCGTMFLKYLKVLS